VQHLKSALFSISNEYITTGKLRPKMADASGLRSHLENMSWVAKNFLSRKKQKACSADQARFLTYAEQSFLVITLTASDDDVRNQ
jgi:hypothetical protein